MSASFRSLIYPHQAHTIAAVMTKVIPLTRHLDADIHDPGFCRTLRIAIKGTCPIAVQAG
jgi:hypothetical protein